jgi:hypothetical protein
MKEAILTKMGKGRSFLAMHIARKSIEAIERAGVKPRAYKTKLICREITQAPERHIRKTHPEELKKETEGMIAKIRNEMRTQKFLDGSFGA